MVFAPGDTSFPQCSEPVLEVRKSSYLLVDCATPTTAVTHIAIHEQLNGKNVDWLEKVTDEEYLAGPRKK